MHKTATPNPLLELSIALIVASIILTRLSNPAYLGTVSALLPVILYYLWRTTRAMTGLALAEGSGFTCHQPAARQAVMRFHLK